MCVSGRVRGLKRQCGQQEDLRGSEETRPAVKDQDFFFITHVSLRFFLFVSSHVVLQIALHPLLPPFDNFVTWQPSIILINCKLFVTAAYLSLFALPVNQEVYYQRRLDFYRGRH